MKEYEHDKTLNQYQEYKVKNDCLDNVHNLFIGTISQKLYNYQKSFLEKVLYSANQEETKGCASNGSNDGYSLFEQLNQLSSQYNKEDLLSSLEEMVSDPDDFSSDIPSLKKRIKYCKNPLERKSLERQLNTVYKAMKKRR